MEAADLRFDGHTHVLPALPEPLTVVSLTLPRTQLDGGRERDEFGVVWQDGVPVSHPLADPAAWTGFVPPAPREDFIRERMEALRNAPGLRVCRVELPLLSRAEALAGPDTLRRAMAEDPAAAHALLKAVCEGTLAVMEAALQYDFDLMALAEDWDLDDIAWAAFVRPYLARLYAMVKAYGHPAAQLGAKMTYLSGLEALGLDVLVPGD